MPEQKSIGALWHKEGQRGVYMTGVIEVDGQQIKIVVFPNSYKKEEKHPDWRIFLSIPREREVEIAPEDIPL